MKKPIEVGQRVAVYRNGNRFCYGVVLEITDTIVDAFVVSGDDNERHYTYLENLRTLKPKPKRVCHCNREPDRWAAFNSAGAFVCSSPTRKSIMEWVTLDACKYVAPVWIGPKVEVK